MDLALSTSANTLIENPGGNLIELRGKPALFSEIAGLELSLLSIGVESVDPFEELSQPAQRANETSTKNNCFIISKFESSIYLSLSVMHKVQSFFT